MRILISNDDGYKADGIIQLTKSLAEIAEVIVVAPSENKSAASSSLTIGNPLVGASVHIKALPLEFTFTNLSAVKVDGVSVKPTKVEDPEPPVGPGGPGGPGGPLGPLGPDGPLGPVGPGGARD